jgi:hypothetical protein
MPSTFIEVAATPVSMVVYSFIGLSCLSFIYGVFGILLMILRLIRVGPKLFFKRIERPVPPTKALDPIYGTHEMIKLKVLDLLFLLLILHENHFIDHGYLLVIGYIHTLCF